MAPTPTSRRFSLGDRGPQLISDANLPILAHIGSVQCTCQRCLLETTRLEKRHQLLRPGSPSDGGGSECSSSHRVLTAAGSHREHGSRQWTPPASPSGVSPVARHASMSRPVSERRSRSSPGSVATSAWARSSSSNLKPQSPRSFSSGKADQDLHDFKWLLNFLFETQVQRPSTPPKRGPPPAPKTVKQELKVLFPETILLDRGMPQKRYEFDADTGAPNVREMRSASELHQVIEELVNRHIVARELAVKKAREDAVAAVAKAAATELHPTDAKRRSSVAVGGGRVRRRSSSGGPGGAGALTKKRGTAFAPTSLPRQSVRSPGVPRKSMSDYYMEPAEISPDLALAALYYVDGSSRMMTFGEAQEELPADFWNRVVMLQVPVVSAKEGGTTRTILYAFDAVSTGSERRPDAMAGWGPLDQGDKVADACRLIEHFIKKKSQHLGDVSSAGIRLLSGKFHFVRDEAAGNLWLVNASHIAFSGSLPSKAGMTPFSANEVMYFREAVLMDDLTSHEEAVESAWRRYQRNRSQAAIQELCQSNAGEEMDEPQEKKISRAPSKSSCNTPPNAKQKPLTADPFCGIDKPIFQSMARICDLETEMLDHWENVTRYGPPVRIPRPPRGVGLLKWFRRWLKACKALSKRLMRFEHEHLTIAAGLRPRQAGPQGFVWVPDFPQLQEARKPDPAAAPRSRSSQMVPPMAQGLQSTLEAFDEVRTRASHDRSWSSTQASWASGLRVGAGLSSTPGGTKAKCDTCTYDIHESEIPVRGGMPVF
eukprot:gnl/TRDRNA2_/TRDRNA2_177188_c7_seq1.p1 gnl/TRDRNA2_/TRDRNA2_177188_c7~~gnl/TRDRNA2_/TRDRNA2_177188_c7_seq1.p1  ORF type:complete len:769 (-),score=122.62 gnl/TRDRNA2_/TRDRNA2_177188_c7_seq1:34-2340(-)